MTGSLSMNRRTNDRAGSAARLAGVADVLVFAFQDGLGLPATIKTWVEQWIPPRRSGGGVLLALVGLSDSLAQNPRFSLLPGNHLLQPFEVACCIIATHVHTRVQILILVEV